MKKIFTFVLVLLLLTTFVQAKEKVSLVNCEWAPFTGSNLKDLGIVFVLVKEAYVRAGYEVEEVIVPWSRCLDGAQKGTYDVVLTVWYASDRAEIYEYSDPFMSNVIRFITVKKKNIPYHTLEDLKGFKIGVIQDYVYDEAFMKADYLNKIDATALESNLKKLLADRIDLTLEDEIVARYTINNDPALKKSKNQFIFLDKELSKKDLYVIVAKSNPRHKQLIKDFNEQLKIMKSKGIYDRLLKKYGF
ncbi:MAG: transporter substrate-binding domain-containing protein [Spirochaetes bacterium]|nr:transporter substrate-binding domain-containing protein [Spirochaetota bacterium]